MPIATPTWINRIWSEYRAGNLTRAARDVLLTLHTYRGTGGVAWPSQATLGERANCDERTVRRALTAAADLGLVRWTERRVRAGWRWLRTSNLYRFVVPDNPVQREPRLQPTSRVTRQVASTTGHCDRGRESQNKKEALDVLLREAAAVPDLLLRRRLAWEAGRVRGERRLTDAA